MKTLVQRTDPEARLVLPKSFANSVVVVQVDEPQGVLTIRKATVEGMDPDQLAVAAAPTAKPGRPASLAIPDPSPSGGAAVGKRLPVRITETRSGKILIEGQPYTRFLKALGLADWDNAEAARLFIKLGEISGYTQLKAVAKKSTIGCQVGDGRKMRRGEEPSHGGLEPTPLSKEKLTALRMLISPLDDLA